MRLLSRTQPRRRIAVSRRAGRFLTRDRFSDRIDSKHWLFLDCSPNNLHRHRGNYSPRRTSATGFARWPRNCTCIPRHRRVCSRCTSTRWRRPDSLRCVFYFEERSNNTADWVGRNRHRLRKRIECNRDPSAWKHETWLNRWILRVSSFESEHVPSVHWRGSTECLRRISTIPRTCRTLWSRDRDEIRSNESNRESVRRSNVWNLRLKQLWGNYAERIYWSKTETEERSDREATLTFSKTGMEKRSARLRTSMQFSTVVSSMRKSSQSLIAWCTCKCVTARRTSAKEKIDFTKPRFSRTYRCFRYSMSVHPCRWNPKQRVSRWQWYPSIRSYLDEDHFRRAGWTREGENVLTCSGFLHATSTDHGFEIIRTGDQNTSKRGMLSRDLNPSLRLTYVHWTSRFPRRAPDRKILGNSVAHADVQERLFWIDRLSSCEDLTRRSTCRWYQLLEWCYSVHPPCSRRWLSLERRMTLFLVHQSRHTESTTRSLAQPIQSPMTVVQRRFFFVSTTTNFFLFRKRFVEIDSTDGQQRWSDLCVHTCVEAKCSDQQNGSDEQLEWVIDAKNIYWKRDNASPLNHSESGMKFPDLSMVG